MQFSLPFVNLPFGTIRIIAPVVIQQTAYVRMRKLIARVTIMPESITHCRIHLWGI